MIRNASTCQQIRWVSRVFVFALASMAAALPARANTYLFSFTGAQLKAALQAADGPTNYNKSVYYGIFVQPSSYDTLNNPTTFLTNGYSYDSVSAPNPGGYEWSADVITDPSNPDLGYGSQTCTVNCSWAGFYKPIGATDVSVVSGAGVSWIGVQYWNFGAQPTGWGGILQGNIITIQNLMSDSALFAFTVTSNAPLSGTYLFSGRAGKLESSTPTDPSDIAKNEVIGFSLALTANEITSVPEPATILLSALPLTLLALLRRKTASSRVR